LAGQVHWRNKCVALETLKTAPSMHNHNFCFGMHVLRLTLVRRAAALTMAVYDESVGSL
jgi:hypothetical protein